MRDLRVCFVLREILNNSAELCLRNQVHFRSSTRALLNLNMTPVLSRCYWRLCCMWLQHKVNAYVHEEVLKVILIFAQLLNGDCAHSETNKFQV